MALMAQLKARGHPDTGKGSYREAMVETWGQVPEYTGRGDRRRASKPNPIGIASRWSSVGQETA